MEAPKDSLELHRENLKRLEALMSADYNAMEMEDYMSYISPDQGKIEVDTFENKLTIGRIPREDLIAKFKAHLGYLAA